MDTADKVLETPYATYEFPLARAREWIKSRDKALLEEAIKLLEELRKRHPHAVPVIPELVLARLESGDLDGARQILAQCGDPIALGEEMLSRYGRTLRESGDAYVCLNGSDKDPDVEIALGRYRLALQQYEDAYAVRQGYYPGINIATLRLLIYAVNPAESRDDKDLQNAKDLAKRLLDGRSKWARNTAEPDDELWRIATAADCYLLREDWAPAAELYQMAKKEPACKPFHVACMRRTAERIISCYQRTGRSNFGPFQDLRNIFG